MEEVPELREGEVIYEKVPAGSRRPRIGLYFALVDGRAECVRVEIGARFQGEGSIELGRRFEDHSRLRPLETSTLRDIKLSSEINKTRKEWVAQLEELARGKLFGVPVGAKAKSQAKSRLPLAREPSKNDRPGALLETEHFEEVATVYREADVKGDPPTFAVAAHFDVPYSTAARWVSRARHEYGLLPKTKRGKARSVKRSRK